MLHRRILPYDLKYYTNWEGVGSATFKTIPKLEQNWSQLGPLLEVDCLLDISNISDEDWEKIRDAQNGKRDMYIAIYFTD